MNDADSKGGLSPLEFVLALIVHVLLASIFIYALMCSLDRETERRYKFPSIDGYCGMYSDLCLDTLRIIKTKLN